MGDDTSCCMLDDLIHVGFHEPVCGSLGDGWPDFGTICSADFGVSGLQESSSKMVSNSSKKRKWECLSNAKVNVSNAEEQKGNCSEMEEKCKQEAPKQSKKKKASPQSLKEKSKASESSTVTPKTDYIHVRARRGQATDSHSLAERVRRERISEKMRYLQELVPGCNKVTGKAGMLDEIINYVQSLQKQVEFLSMKLASVNPVLDFTVDNLFHRQTNQTCNFTGLPGTTIPCGVQFDPSYLRFNSMQPTGSGFGLDMVMENKADLSIAIPVGSIDSCLPVNGSSSWASTLQNHYSVGCQQASSFDLQFQSSQGIQKTQDAEATKALLTNAKELLYGSVGRDLGLHGNVNTASAS